VVVVGGAWQLPDIEEVGGGAELGGGWQHGSAARQQGRRLN
jgi:hypothetical protein